MKKNRTVGRKCDRKSQPSNRKSFNACWQARDAEARPSERNGLHNANRMHEINAINVLLETARDPFIGHAIENENRPHEMML